MIKASEIKSVEFSFIPLKKKKYKIQIPVSIKQMDSKT